MKWIGQHIYDQVSRFRNDVIIEDIDGSSITMKAGSTDAALNYSYPLTILQPVNDASPSIVLGSSVEESLQIRAFYQSGTQEMQVASFATRTAETDVDRGKFQFTVDGANIVAFLDDGIDLYTSKGISINGTDILTDSSGTATLSNIDALDATTISTLNAALTAGDITGVTAGTGLSGGGTSGAVTLNVDAAQTGITSLGTLTALAVDDIVLNSARITLTGSEGDTFTIDTTTHGATTLTTHDQAATAAHFEIAADGDITLDSAGQIKLEPVAGNNILLDGTIAVDAGVVTGATSITSTAFVGGLTGEADTAVLAADATTLATPRAINGVDFDGSAAITIPTNRVYGATIKLLPNDFLPNEDGGTSKGMFLDDSAPTGLKPGIAAMELVAVQDIPEGFKATHVDVYASTNLVIQAYEMDLNASGITSRSSAGNANTTLDITDVNATATNFIAIIVTTTATTNRVWGGTITIAPQ